MNVHTGARRSDDGAQPSRVPAFENFLQENPQVQYVDCIFVDLCGIVRGKRVARDELARVFDTGLQIPYTIYFLDARGDMVDGIDAGAPRGAREGTAKPVPGTLTRVNWSQRPHGQVLMTLCTAKGDPYFGEPRNVLARVVERFGDIALTPSVGCALEFHVVDRESAKSGAPQTAKGDAESREAILVAIGEAARTQGLPEIEVKDVAAGQCRVSFAPVSDAVRAGDHAVLLRQIVRAVARQHGLDATFMAKPYLDRPGSAMRIRTSVLKEGGENAFDDGRIDGDAILRFAVGGLQAVMGDSLALFAPNANAFRRFAAPDAIARNKRWGYSSPTTVVGVTGEADARHIEHRLAGADANPYLVLAAVLTGIHHGVVERLEAGAPFDGKDAAAFVDQTLPFNIDAALVALENGSILREYLGPAYVDLYVATKRAELERFRNHIPAHEYDWYL